eukprot:2124569-Karenia_brevis.AAC.1
MVEPAPEPGQNLMDETTNRSEGLAGETSKGRRFDFDREATRGDGVTHLKRLQKFEYVDEIWFRRTSLITSTVCINSLGPVTLFTILRST